MATQAQILANRRNAQKSTGPRTIEGKAVVSQNAVKHGLLARHTVISSETQADFNLHRDRILADLDPLRATEYVLAERIVSLSWRLKRAERMQNQAFDAKLEDYTHDSWSRRFRTDQDESQPDLTLGRVALRDFTNYRVLDRLQLYERRIEQSLYKAMLEFQKLTLTRKPKRSEDPGTEAQTPHLKKQTQFAQSAPETPHQTGPCRDLVQDSHETPSLKKQTQYAECPNECKPNSEKDLPKETPSQPPPNQTQPNPISNAKKCCCI